MKVYGEGVARHHAALGGNVLPLVADAGMVAFAEFTAEEQPQPR